VITRSVNIDLGGGCSRNATLVVRFLRGHTNVLVASDVLEEGIDIQKCNLVVKFDVPKNYRSYVQSKGRARHQSSKYIMMVPCTTTGVSFTSKYYTYKATENAVQNVSTLWLIWILIVLICCSGKLCIVNLFT
jgi:ERCC4-related helicase